MSDLLQDEQGRWNVFGGKLQWQAWAICSNNPDYGGEGAPKRGDDYTAAPNIDHTNPAVKKDLTEWLRHLVNFGFKGWRLDYVKGYSKSLRTPITIFLWRRLMPTHMLPVLKQG
jgi:alpha-amylase